MLYYELYRLVDAGYRLDIFCDCQTNRTGISPKRSEASNSEKPLNLLQQYIKKKVHPHPGPITRLGFKYKNSRRHIEHLSKVPVKLTYYR